MKRTLHPCPECDRHVDSGATSCPFCAADFAESAQSDGMPWTLSRRSAGLLTLGAFVSACRSSMPKDSTPPPPRDEPTMYGMPTPHPKNSAKPDASGTPAPKPGEETKPDGSAKPDEKKPDEKKPDEKKPDEKKPDEKKPDEQPQPLPRPEPDQRLKPKYGMPTPPRRPQKMKYGMPRPPKK